MIKVGVKVAGVPPHAAGARLHKRVGGRQRQLLPGNDDQIGLRFAGFDVLPRDQHVGKTGQVEAGAVAEGLKVFLVARGGQGSSDSALAKGLK